MSADRADVSPILAPAPIETALAQAAGRIPVMAFVDAATEQALHYFQIQQAARRTAFVRGGVTKAIEVLSRERSPNLLIVDISGASLPLSQMQRLAEVCEPDVVVVAIGDQNDVGLYRELIEAGVAEYIVKPVTRELLARALSPRRGPGELGRTAVGLGKLIAVVGARGGVGATTVAANLAWHLANRQSRRVALFDLDLQNGDCALTLNTKPISGLHDALANPFRIDQILVERLMRQHGERLYVLSCEEPLHEVVDFTPTAAELLLNELRYQFHYVVVDVPRTPAPRYRRALEMANLRILVADQTMRSVRDAARLRALLGEDSAEQRNILVINRGGEGGRAAVPTGEMQDVLEMHSGVIIPFQPALFAAAANKAQLPAARRGKFADAIARLALEISGRALPAPSWWRLRR